MRQSWLVNSENQQFSISNTSEPNITCLQKTENKKQRGRVNKVNLNRRTSAISVFRAIWSFCIDNINPFLTHFKHPLFSDLTYQCTAAPILSSCWANLELVTIFLIRLMPMSLPQSVSPPKESLKALFHAWSIFLEGKPLSWLYPNKLTIRYAVTEKHHGSPKSRLRNNHNKTFITKS